MAFPSHDEAQLAKENEQRKGFATFTTTTSSLEWCETATTKVLWPRYERKKRGTLSCNCKITRQESKRQKKSEITFPISLKRERFHDFIRRTDDRRSGHRDPAIEEEEEEEEEDDKKKKYTPLITDLQTLVHAVTIVVAKIERTWAIEN